MSRSDFYGIPYFVRKRANDACSVKSRVKPYLTLPIIVGTIFFSSPTSLSNVSLTQKQNEIHMESDLRGGAHYGTQLEISKYNLIPHIESRIQKVLGSESSKEGLELVMSKLSAYEDYIQEASSETGLSANFIKAYLATESSGDSNAVSEKGATGLGGLMVVAARESGLRVDGYVDERLDAKSILGSARYMKKCIDLFNDKVLGLIAYNAGPTWLFENLARIKEGSVMENEKIPLESRSYVIHVLSKAELISDKSYGLRIENLPLVSESISLKRVVQKSSTLAKLARTYGVSVKSLRRVNPSLKGNFVPKDTEINLPRS